MTYAFEASEPSRSELTSDQVEDYIAAAKKHYTDDLQYHNWDHAQAVMDGVDVITQKFERRGIPMARGALRVAAAWHDAGFHEDHTALGFATKEAYSAALLDDFLEDEPVSEVTRRTLLRDPIVATYHGHPRIRMPAELILHRADIANIGGPTEGFIEANTKLWHENGRQDWAKHLQGTRKFVEFTMAEHQHESLIWDIRPNTTIADVYNESFPNAATRNLAALEQMDAPA